MGENFESKKDDTCAYARQMGLGDNICTAAVAQQDHSNPHKSPFDRNSREPQNQIEGLPVIRIEPLKVEPQKVEPQKVEPPRFEPPKFEPPKIDPPKEQRPAPVVPRTQPVLPEFKLNPGTNTTGGANGKTVYVDIGHCTSRDEKSIDKGFQSESYNECQINQAVGKLLISDLKSAGFRVVPTWDPARPPAPISKQEDLARRNNVVNADIARNKSDSIYVSIHHDNDSSGESGQCVYYAEPKRNESMTLAQTIQRAAWNVRNRDTAPSCINPDTVTHNGKLVGLRGVNTIAVLVEGANVQNGRDKQFMMSPKWQESEAQHIAQGVVNYFKLKPGIERPYAPGMRR